MVAVVSLTGLVAVMVAGLEQRRRELAVLRSIGAPPRQVFAVLLLEAALVTVVGVVAGILAWATIIAMMRPLVESEMGVSLRIAPRNANEWMPLGLIVGGGVLGSLLPGWGAYRLSLSDGLSRRG